MAFEGLTEKLSNAFKKLRGKGRLSEADVKEAMREIRLALLEADVNYKVVKDFIKKTTERCRRRGRAREPDARADDRQDRQRRADRAHGQRKPEADRSPRSRPPSSCSSACRARARPPTAPSWPGFSKSRARVRCSSPAISTVPAAIKQLQVVGEQLGIPVFEMGQTNPVDIAKAAVAHAVRHGNDMVFLDTAGRLHVDEALMDELKAIKAAVKPDEILLVVDAMTGQDAVNAATDLQRIAGHRPA